MSTFAPPSQSLSTSPVQKDALKMLLSKQQEIDIFNDEEVSHFIDDQDDENDNFREEEVEELVEDNDHLETDYGNAKYWDERYDRYSPFDWLMGYDHFKSQGLTEFMQNDDNILMIGCGSAAFSQEMYDDGYNSIHNIDLSPVVIQQMSEANVDRHSMTWTVMNCTELSFDDETFDVAFDKSTMDCIFCCDNSNHQISEMMMESWRVLKPGGVFISLSLHNVDKCLPFIESDEHGNPFDWNEIEAFSVPNPRYEPGTEKSEKYVCIVAIKPAVSDAKVRSERGVKHLPDTLPKFERS